MSIMKSNGELAGRTVLVLDSSQGIGKAIAVKAARDGANVLIAVNTSAADPCKGDETIHTTAKEVEAAGGRCLPCVVDIRDEDQVQAAVDKVVETFGGIDILINASAPAAIGNMDTPAVSSRVNGNLMMNAAMRGAYHMSKLCLPHLMKSSNPHILNISPPLTTIPMWFASQFTSTAGRYGVSMSVLGMAEEFREDGVAVNALWPSMGVAGDAIEMLADSEGCHESYIPEIMADAAYAVLNKPSRECTGQFLLDDQVLFSEGITDLTAYLQSVAEEKLKKCSSMDSPQDQSAAPTDMTTPKGVFAAIEPLITDQTVRLINGSFLFELSGKNAGCWLLVA